MRRAYISLRLLVAIMISKRDWSAEHDTSTEGSKVSKVKRKAEGSGALVGADSTERPSAALSEAICL